MELNLLLTVLTMITVVWLVVIIPDHYWRPHILASGIIFIVFLGWGLVGTCYYKEQKGYVVQADVINTGCSLILVVAGEPVITVTDIKTYHKYMDRKLVPVHRPIRQNMYKYTWYVNFRICE